MIKINKRTMMVLYRSPEQTDLHTYYWSFSQVYCSKTFVEILELCPHPLLPSEHVFKASWRLELNLDRESPKEHFCRYTEISLVPSDKKKKKKKKKKKIKVFYIGKISPAPSGHVFWRIITAWTNLVENYQWNIPAKLYWNRFSGFWQ